MAPSDGIVTEMALTVGADTPAVAGLLAANEQEYAVTASLTAEQASLLKAGGTISVMQEQNTGTATLEQVNDDLAQFTVSGTQWKTGAADITVTTMGGTTGLGKGKKGSQKLSIALAVIYAAVSWVTLSRDNILAELIAIILNGITVIQVLIALYQKSDLSKTLLNFIV